MNGFKKYNFFQILAVMLTSGVVFFGCNTIDIFEKFENFPKNEWHISKQPTFSFEVKDTVSRYYIYFVIRHTDAYKYNNIWVNIGTQSPAGSKQTQLVNLKLADNVKGWLGAGMDDIYDSRIKITKEPVTLKAGIYNFTIAQAMRDEPLLAVLCAGIRVEKAMP
jgi:gliding motility-associated lipoprotein GldH